MLEDLGRAWRAAARTLGLAFELHIAPAVPRTVQLDSLQRQQVLMLRRHAFATLNTSDGGQALALWRQGGVHALVTDLDLPGMSELALIRTLRAEEQPGARRTLVIVCSGSPVPAADDAADRALYDAYLVKPVDVATLADTLHRRGVAEAASPPGAA